MLTFIFLRSGPTTVDPAPDLRRVSRDFRFRSFAGEASKFDRMTMTSPG